MTAAPITIELRERDTVIRIYGPIDSSTSPAVSDALQRVPGTGPIIIDLRKTLYINSKGVGVLSQAFVWARQAGRDFGFLLEEGPVNETMSLVGVLELIASAPNEELLTAQFEELRREKAE